MLIDNPPVEIADNLWMLGTVAYPIYLFKGPEEGVIFEGGIGAMGPVLREQIEKLDIGQDFVKQVVVTHGHPDHVMAVPMFRELFPNASVLASTVAAKTLSAEKAISFFCQIDEALTGALLKAGLISEEHRPQPLVEKQIDVDRVVQEGDVIEVDGARFHVLETPGHSDCSLSFHEPDRRVLLISDASGYYLPDHEYWWPNYFANYEAYLRSMRRLAEVGAEVLCLSHNGVIKGAEDVRSYFDRAIEATEEYHRRIVEDTNCGKSVREIAEQLGSEAYDRTPLLPLDFFQKNCGVLVKQSLKHEGIGK